MGQYIFVSYRRGDAVGYVWEIINYLQDHFGTNRVCIDITDIHVSDNFSDAINHAIISCQVVIIIIGPNWIKIEDEMGRRRLDDPHDFARVELEAALKNNIHIIPVLVQGAKMPFEEDLPYDLRALASFRPVEIRKRHYDSDLLSLKLLLDRYLSQDIHKTLNSKKKNIFNRTRLFLAVFAVGFIGFMLGFSRFRIGISDAVNSIISKPHEFNPDNTISPDKSSPMPRMTKTISSESETITSTITPSVTKTDFPSPTLIDKEVFLSPEIIDAFGISMVLIPQGPFLMGTNNPDPWNLVSQPLFQMGLDMYYIDKFEITNEQYQACVSAGHCNKPLYNRSKTRESYFGNPSYDQFPVIYVNWWEAVSFCSRRGGRLPTEAEWEKAARGENFQLYPWGETSPDCEHANYTPIEPCVGDTVSVDSLGAGSSPYRVFNLSGNVQEWVYDWFQPYPGGKNEYSIEFGTTHKVIRGGSFFDGPSHIQVTSRKGLYPDSASSYVGFRCVLDISALP